MHASPWTPALTAWELEPGIILPLLLSAGLYARGAVVLRSRRRTAPRTKHIVWFAAGWLTLALALVGPIHEISEQLFSMHMVQHELLMAVAAPLLVVARPFPVFMWGLPRRARLGVARWLRNSTARRLWAQLVRPFDAWLLHGLAIWVWHIPALFDATLESSVAHALQHLSFFGSALLFWWAMLYGQRRAARGMSIIYLFTTGVHTAVLGALITFARSPWYAGYAATTSSWGLTPLADQQLAGLIMWIPAGVVYLVATLAIMWRWLEDSQWDAAHADDAALAASR